MKIKKIIKFENRYNGAGRIMGARFIFVETPSAESETTNPESAEKPPENEGIKMPFNYPTADAGKKPEGQEKKEAQENNPEGDLTIPERAKEAMKGSEFAKHLETKEREARERARAEGKSPSQIEDEVRRTCETEVYDQLRNGNIPQHMRQLKDVPVQMTDANGNLITGQMKVMPDYICIGSDEDSLRVPMTPATAQILARQWGCTLPTPAMVDAIAKEARLHGIALQPKPKPPISDMNKTYYFVEHDATIDQQLGNVTGNPLIDGDKKDIVLPYYNEGGTHVAIYGWHSPDGKAIQGYSNGIDSATGRVRGPHENTYMDYSHGVRFVLDSMTITFPDGHTERRKVTDVMADPNLHGLVSAAVINNAANAYPDNRWTSNFDHARPAGAVIKQPEDVAQPTPGESTPGGAPDTSGTGETTVASADTNAEAPGTLPPAPPPDSMFAVGPGPAAGPGTAPANVAAPAPTPANVPSGVGSGGAAPSTPGAPTSVAGSGGAPSAIPRGAPSSTPANQPANVPPPDSMFAVGPGPQSSPGTGPTSPSSATGTSTGPGPATGPSGAQEKREGEPGIINGSVVFLGDSISVGMHNSREIKATGIKDSIAKGSMPSTWLLNEITQPPNPERIKFFDHAAVLIGTNDIGNFDPPGTPPENCKWTAEAIFNRIQQVWSKLREFNPNIKIYAATIPPFKGHTFSTYGSRFDDVNNKRIAINNMIKSSNIPNKVIDLCRSVTDGGLASSNDDATASLDDNVKGDWVHPKKDALADIYMREIAGISPAKNPPQGGGDEVVANTPPSTPSTPSTGAETLANSYIVPPETPPIVMQSENDAGKVPKFTGNDPMQGVGRVPDANHPPSPAPPGWKRVSVAPGKSSRYVNKVLKDWAHVPINTKVQFEIDGQKYLALNEWHQSPENSSATVFEKKPHHGWAVLVPISGNPPVVSGDSAVARSSGDSGTPSANAEGYTPAKGAVASRELREFIASGAAYGSEKEVEVDGKKYMARYTVHTEYGADPSKPHSPHPAVELRPIPEAPPQNPDQQVT